MENNSQNLIKVENIYKQNYSKILNIFVKNQILFLSRIYNRCFNDLESGSIVLYFSKILHKSILEEKINDLNYNISLVNFWDKIDNTPKRKLNIISIAKGTCLPKETVRRKINKLISKNILKKKDNKISWEINAFRKITNTKIIEQEMYELSEFIYIVAYHSGQEISKTKIIASIKKNFSFFWYHYLNAQLKYFYVWQNEFNDLELLLIYQECIYQANKIYEKEKIDYENHFLTKKSFFKGIVPSVSATTINNTTKIPRATCIRKLDKLVKIGFLKKNSFTKKYSTNINFTTHVLPQSKKISKEAIGIFSKFYLRVVKIIIND